MIMKDINIWETDFRVILSTEIISYIKKEIKDKYSMDNFSRKTNLSKTVIYRLLNGKGSANKNYKIIATELNIFNPENYVIGVTYNGSKFVYPFVKQLNPSLFRIICHVVGDGTIASRNTCRWIQKTVNSH